MGLKSRRWFETECYHAWSLRGPLSDIAHRSLELSYGIDNTSGHMLQAIGAVQQFYDTYPNYLGIVKSSPFQPFKMGEKMLSDWLNFIKGKKGSYGRKDFKYNWDHFKNALTNKYGGNTTGGGGGDNEFEIVLRLIADFI